MLRTGRKRMVGEVLMSRTHHLDGRRETRETCVCEGRREARVMRSFTKHNYSFLQTNALNYINLSIVSVSHELIINQNVLVTIGATA